MYLCEVYNLSVGIPAYKYRNLLYTDDSKTVKGPIGKEFQLFVKTRKKFPNYCTFVNIYKVGEKLPNGSYDGALGAIERKEIDLFLRGEIPFTDNQNIHLSYPVNTEEFFIYQTINKKELDISDFKMQLIKSFNLEFLFYYFLVTLLFTLISLIFYLSISSLKKEKKSNVFINRIKVFKLIKFQKIKYFSFIFFGLIWFDFLTKQIITNNIKTTKVIVDTSDLITTEEKLFKSSLKAAWLEGESDLLIAKNAPNNTFLKKLYVFKNENPIKVFTKNLDLETVLQLNKYFFFLKNYILKVFINLLSTLQKDDAFYNEKPFYSIFTVFYISKLSDQNKINFVYKTSQFVGQTGYSAYFVKRLYSANVFDGPKRNKVYTNLNSYIDDYTKFDSLKYESFYYFFLVYFFFNSTFLFICTFKIYFFKKNISSS